MTIEIVDFPINSMVIFHCYVSSPEGRHIRMQWYDLLQMSLTVGHSALLQRVLERPKGKSEAAGESGYHMLEHPVESRMLL